MRWGCIMSNPKKPQTPSWLKRYVEIEYPHNHNGTWLVLQIDHSAEHFVTANETSYECRVAGYPNLLTFAAVFEERDPFDCVPVIIHCFFFSWKEVRSPGGLLSQFVGWATCAVRPVLYLLSLSLLVCTSDAFIFLSQIWLWKGVYNEGKYFAKVGGAVRHF